MGPPAIFGRITQRLRFTTACGPQTFRIELLWEDDSRHIFTSDNEGTKIEYYSASQQRLYMVEGNKIAEGILGAWYQAPRNQQRTTDPNKLYESLQGSWNLQGNRILSILNDRLAQLYAEDGQLKQTGRWTRKEKALEIIWDTGNFARLQFEGSQYSYSEIAAAHPIHQASSIAAQVTRNYSHTVDPLLARNRPATLSFDTPKAQVKFSKGLGFLNAQKMSMKGYPSDALGCPLRS